MRPDASPRALSVAVAIATSGRPAILAQTLALLERQTRLPDRILICPAKDSDIEPDLLRSPSRVSVVRGPAGLPAQRNTLLAAAAEADVLVFFDDDFFAEPAYLAEIEALFLSQPDLVLATGDVIADGILGPGLAPERGEAVLNGLGALPAEELTPVYNGYGCNMAVRMAPVRERGLRFDEALPLYGWLEDVDFSRRLASSGSMMRSNRLRGVHLGNKGGRSSGVRLGYSQIVNPLYMVRKGTLERGRAVKQIGRNILANAAKAWRPEPWVDRRGRLMGNLRGLADALGGRLDPRRILEM